MDTEAEAVAELVVDAAGVSQVEIDPTDPATVAVVRTNELERWVEIDGEAHGYEPRRSAGKITVTDADSFAKAIEQRRLGPYTPVIYSDERNLKLVAVLNDDQQDGDDNTVTGWRDYRIELDLAQTPEWESWKGLDRKMVAQLQFAEHIELNTDDVVEPSSAEMLEIAQNFQARRGGEFRSGLRLATGNVQFLDVVDNEATTTTAAGTSVQVPELFTIALAPFYGAGRYATVEGSDEPGEWGPARFSLQARLRWRITSGKLELGYHLVRPDDMVRTAYLAFVERVKELTELDVLAAPAPPISDVPNTVKVHAGR